MPRPRKCRRICALPETTMFAPCGAAAGEAILMTVDEYEMLRLIDLEGLSQEECGAQMGVARTTVQLCYASARRKVAQALVQGQTLQIGGGEYQLCQHGSRHCHRRTCAGRTTACAERKGENDMKIAVTYENGQVFQHFGHTEAFKVYDAEDGRIVSSKVVSTNGQGHGALAAVLAGLEVDALICGGIGGGAQMALARLGIKLYGGVQGDADAAAEALAKGELNYDPNARCDHHGEHHGNHECGEHGCH